jgi:hypothetical protein
MNRHRPRTSATFAQATSVMMTVNVSVTGQIGADAT